MTSSPVNAHLTPGPGIYFNAVIHLYSPSAGADNPLGTNVDVNIKPLLPFAHLLQVWKWSLRNLIFKHIFNDFIHVCSPGARAYNPLGTLLMSAESPYHFADLILYTFLMILYMYITPGQGQTNPWGKNFDVNRKALSFWPFLASSKKTLWRLVYTYFLMFLCMYISPGQEQTTTCWQSFDVNKKLRSLTWRRHLTKPQGPMGTFLCCFSSLALDHLLQVSK